MDPKEFNYFFLKSLTERLTKENNKIMYVLTMYGNLIPTLTLVLSQTQMVIYQNFLMDVIYF